MMMLTAVIMMGEGDVDSTELPTAAGALQQARVH